LDFLRAAAIVMVMIFHASLFGLLPSDSWFVGFAWIGVDLFFVFSGFLIAGQLFRPLRHGEAPNTRRFFVRRLLRTLPAYFVVVAIYFAFPVVRERSYIQPAWQFLTFTQNIVLDPTQPKSFSHAWSLCVEEQFYLLLPLLVASLGFRARAEAIIGAIVAILFFGMAIRGYVWLHDVARQAPMVGLRPDRYLVLIYYPTWMRLDGLLAGVTLAAIRTFRPEWWRRLTLRPNALLAIGAIGIVTAAVLFQGQLYGALLASVFGFPLVAWSFAAFVAAGVESRSIIGRHAIPGSGALATGAYSLYLSHKMIFQGAQAVSRAWSLQIPGLAFGVALFAAFLGGAALYWLVERPFLRLRDRLDGGAVRHDAVSSPTLAPAQNS
jgi:peptidoglycan/LPS O-acetylase OafA/YrhL